MNEKAEAHARRVGEIENEAKARGEAAHAHPGSNATMLDLSNRRYSVDQTALGWLAAEHANALERIADLKKRTTELERLCTDLKHENKELLRAHWDARRMSEHHD